MLQRIFRPAITSPKCIFPHIADIKQFSVSTICSKKAFNSRPPSIFFAYKNAIYPRDGYEIYMWMLLTFIGQFLDSEGGDGKVMYIFKKYIFPLLQNIPPPGF